MIEDFKEEDLPIADEFEDTENKMFELTDLEGCSWALRKLTEVKKKEAEINKLYELEVSRIEAWKADELKSVLRDKEYFETLLSLYYKKQKELDLKFKISTPYGKVSSRKSTKWNFTNEAEAIEYLKNNNPELIKTTVTEKIDKLATKKLFKGGINSETGECLPGVEVIEEDNVVIKAE